SLDNMVGYYFLKSGVEDREIIIVQDVENLNEILAEYSRVWFIYQEVEKRENLIPIRDWVEKQEGIVYEIGFFRLFYTGNNVSQLELVNEAYQLDNSEFNFRVVGTYYFKLHMFEEAVQAFEKVIELQPELMANHLRLAYLYDQLGEFDKALATYQYVLQMNKKNPSYHAALGDFYFRNEKHDMALIEYSEAVKLWETASWKSNSKNDLALINTWKLIINGLENQ
ncbi:MAG: tetratricopeptide repeat protein, partial [Candidatus Heimdallarchaeota archaeon]|nr:tetratricopeptide repeat protein [Candidatus Heimdallarchaeota archaeon]